MRLVFFERPVLNRIIALDLRVAHLEVVFVFEHIFVGVGLDLLDQFLSMDQNESDFLCFFSMR